MSIYIIYSIIILLTILIYIIVKDKRKVFKLLGLLKIISSSILMVMSLIIKIIINNIITKINLSFITNYIIGKFMHISITLFIVGVIEIIISKTIHSKVTQTEIV